MDKVKEGIQSLRAAVFGDSDKSIHGTYKPYSVRLPTQISSHIEVIANTSKLSRNVVIIDIIELGLNVFLQDMTEEERESFMNDVYEMNGLIESESGDL